MTHETQAARARREDSGRIKSQRWTRAGKVRWAVLLWALGVPLPLVLLFLLVRGCM